MAIRRFFLDFQKLQVQQIQKYGSHRWRDGGKSLITDAALLISIANFVLSDWYSESRPENRYLS